MQALVVYESMFGTTRDVARAIGNGLFPVMDVDLVEVGTATCLVDTDLLVVGGPTHAFGMSRSSTRQDAARQAAHATVSVDDGVREWLERVLPAVPGLAAAAFDTRVASPRVPGSAAKAIHRRLRRLGFEPVVPAESFWVDGTQGPLASGEAERAREWGAHLADLVAHRAHRTHGMSV
ncbi:flavodoxin family protein [uncultured Cellulomonas sp.]|uniref:flavodoxin family protein n=1 Tax=uncultured Cellulomonas sp. TaxID=189682 RepID=UPI00262751B3|nr:flavodoxin family protein [uncultured Cellulomonas sp.]